MQRCTVPLVLCLLLISSASPIANPQDEVTPDLFTRRSPIDEAANQKQLLEILNAFKPITVAASAATVWILEGDRKLVLGTVVDANGLILTKASEVENRALRCLFHDGSHAPATITRIFPLDDVAFLQVPRDRLTIAPFIAAEPIGGSPIATPSPNGDVTGVGVVSVGIRDLSGQDKGYLGLAVITRNSRLVIQEIIKGSAAEKAGLAEGDILVSLDGVEFDTIESFVEYVSTLKPGTKLHALYRREGEIGSTEVTLGNRAEAPERFNPLNAMDIDTSTHRTGYPNVWQHDIGLAPTYMGGPAVDLDGRVLGINIARAGRVKTYVIPSTLILEWLANTTPKPTPDVDEAQRTRQSPRKGLVQPTED